MSKFLRSLLVILMSVMTSMAFAQGKQLPDPGFEDWAGTEFSGNIQPKYWNYSNVSQMGVDKNFAHQTTGRSGKALKIQDQFVGVLGIGATSPGYVALGHPWAYVSGLTSIEDATAGTYGGIAWNSRPDSMVVWIKRYYDSSVDKAAGDHTQDENFNLIFYSWSGTSYPPAFKAKNLTCTDISSEHKDDYCVDEESDIRQLMDGNECKTQVLANQIAEGWYYEKKAYGNWTRITVPIFYLNDDVPEKCNVILSAGNYPNFRANSGQNAGMSMDVDDISLVYSSKVQKIYLNNGITNKEWKAFDPDNTDEQICSLGLGATTMPVITCVRGAGSLTNNRGGKGNFPGRQLGTNECTITYGEVDGAPTIIKVTAEDGSSTTTYTIKFVSEASNNAKLADIQVNDQPISGFNAYLTSYNVSLPYGTTEAPVVKASAQDGTATIDIQQATSPTGTAKITVTAGDGTTKMEYTISFSVAALTDVTLKAIYLDGSLLPGYVPTKSNYTVSLPLGTTTVPAVTWESNYAAGVQTIKLLNNSLEQGAQIQVSIPGSTLSKTYKITYKIEASSYSYLAGIAIGGTALEDFAPEKTVYNITLPLGTTQLPAITWTTGDNYQTVKLIEGGVDGVTRIEVTAASGAVTTYRLNFQTEKSTNNALAGIALDGTPLETFHADTLNYTIVLPAGTAAMPAVTYTQGDAYQKVTMSVNQAQMTVRLTVTAGNGTTRVYLLSFEIEKSANALLQMIYLNGTELAGFVPEQLDYSIVWTSATMPKVTVLANVGQSIAISTPVTYGVVRIVVTPEEGTPNTYTVRLNSPDEVTIPAFPMDSFPASSNANLAALYIDGEPYADFNPNTVQYTYPLAWHTFQVPAIMPVAGTTGQIITIKHGAVNHPTLIEVEAADKTTKKTYTIDFPVAKSSNTNLASVEIDGVNFTFDPATKTYTGIGLPYGTTHTPSLTVERAEPEQSLVITEAPLGKPSTIVVTAEDGTQATYSFSYQLAFPDKTNELLAIVLDGIGALDMTQGPDFTINMPYGTTGINIVSISKNYPEQEVQVIYGGVYEPTTITVKSLNPAEADKIYTITLNVPHTDPAQLLDIKVGGTSIAQFRSDVYNYVLSVTGATPEVTYTAQEGAEVDVDSNAKWVKLSVTAGESDEYKHTYLVTYFYPEDVYFDTSFDNWESLKNPNVTSETGERPKGWNAPITAPTSGDAGTYYPWDNTHGVTSPKTQGTKSAELSTTYLLTSAEAMPGFLSLATPTVSVGKWILGVYELHSSLAFGDPVSFRNTPDNVAIDYYLDSYQNNANGWMFVYNANGMKQIDHAAPFNSMTKKKWYTFSQGIAYDENFVPMTLDILICAAPSTTLENYYTNFGTKRSTSKMYVDNLRLDYNSVLNGLNVNGTAATISGTSITATVDAESYGVPSLLFAHAVQDQMPVVTWGEESNGVRTATIRNYAENLSYTDYTLTVTRPQSTNTNCTYSLDGNDLTIAKGSPYQTIAVTTNDTAYVITVTAESGAQAVYYASWASAGSGAATVTNVPAETPNLGVSTARLTNLVESPIINYDREYALDSVTMIATDTCYYINVYGTGAAVDTTYIIARDASANALLASMATNNTEVPDFYEQTFDYVVSLPSLDAFSATAQDPNADVQYTTVKIDDNHVVVFVLVTASDGKTQARYTVLVKLHTLATDAYLISITVDDVLVTGFQSDKYDYTISLPSGSAIPQLASIACEGATVEMTTIPSGSSATVTFEVTSEDGLTQRTYTVHVNVLPSAICTLSNLFAGDDAVEGFQSDKFSYDIELPYGTQTLPELEYILTDKKSTAVVTTNDKTMTVTVTAEDGVHTNAYVVNFTIAKSTNADLESISLDGTPIATFFADEYSYTISLPYGSTMPVITAVAADSTATVVINGNTITVTAEDGVTTHTYTVNFTILPSTDANLMAILLDGVLQNGFAPDEYTYLDTVLYGAEMPVITWITGDDQQTVDTVWMGDTELTITVTAGDGVTTSEYTLTFEHLLSSNWHLSDLQVLGVTITGFDRDSLNYELVYPIGTDPASLCDETQIIAIPEDADATVSVSMAGNVIQIFVTAADGTIGVYTIEQTILLSSEARLKMIWLDGVEVRDYYMDTLKYTILQAPGAAVPEITAEPLDTLATWELGMEQTTATGKSVEIYCTAQDGTTLVYVLTFEYADWTASSIVDPDDYLFIYVGGGDYKAITIGVGIQVAVYDHAGRLLLIETIEPADPADVEVEVAEDGNQILKSALPSAKGVVFHASPAQPYFYVFFDSKTKKIAKGGKFEFVY